MTMKMAMMSVTLALILMMITLKTLALTLPWMFSL